MNIIVFGFGRVQIIKIRIIEGLSSSGPIIHSMQQQKVLIMEYIDDVI